MANKASGKSKSRRSTAQAMAAKQRSISVSEFFAKNRHLLGFDNPRKALLTTVKEAVDNSLDACEEAGIAPEIWVNITQTEPDRYQVSIQDNGPGILKKQIPLIFGKLLYGSKFHRLRMSRGQQGIGISAAGMYGMLTTGKPVKIVSKLSIRKPAHYYELQIDTKTNNPQILNNRGDGLDIPAGEKGRAIMEKKKIEWEAFYPVPEVEPSTSDDEHAEGETETREAPAPVEVRSGTRVTLEIEAKYQRGRGSVDEYLEMTAIANPHVTLHYTDPEGTLHTYARSTDQLPPEAKEIKPHPYGVELGRLVTMLKELKEGTITQFLTSSFSRVSPAVARRICETAEVSTRSSVKKISRDEADKIYKAIQQTKIKAPSTDCIAPIGEELLLKGLHQVVPGEFYVAATRPPSVYRGNPFQIECALAYGGQNAAQKVSIELLERLIEETDARTLRQFLMNTFDGLGSDSADKIMKAGEFGSRQSPSKLKQAEIERLHDSMKNVNVSDGQAMQVLRYANRVPLQFKMRDCAITQTVMKMNWRSYGLSQSRSNLPSGPVRVMVHVASVWVPFTSESKEAIAHYDEIQKEIRLGLQTVGRKLGMFLRRRQQVKKEGERRNVFVRYLGEVAQAVSDLNGCDKEEIYNHLTRVAKRVTKEADTKLDDRGNKVSPEDYGGNVLIINDDPEGELTEQLDKTTPQKKLF